MSITGDPIPGQNPEYSPFHPDLDNKYPVSGLGLDKKSRDLIIEGAYDKDNWLHTFSSSPAQNMEAEWLMGIIITDAIRAGQWIDIPESSAEDMTRKPFVANTPLGPYAVEGITYQFKRGVDKLEKSGFITRSEDVEGQKFIQPTEQLMHFIDERIGFQKM